MGDITPAHKPGASTIKKWEKQKKELRTEEALLKDAQFSKILARIKTLEDRVEKLEGKKPKKAEVKEKAE